MNRMLRIDSINVFYGAIQALNDVSIEVNKGEIVAIIGSNGAGKSTLLRTLALLVPADAGTIRWQAQDVATDPDRWRSQIAWLGHLDGLKADLTVRENLHSSQPDHVRVEAAVVAFDLAVLATREVRTLSAGQRRRAALARVVATTAPLWLLDEPLNALDVSAQSLLHSAIARHLAEGGVAIAATHADMPGARPLELGA